MIKIAQVMQGAQLNWSGLYVELDQHSDLRHEFSVTPDDYLGFAKADLRGGETRGLVNAVCNAKRVIDCQTDTLLASLGLRSRDLASQLGKNHIKDACYESSTDQPLAYRLLESFGVVTPSIVGRMRRLRNQVEHQYTRPSKRNATDAIDIADLYIGAVRGLMKQFWTDFGIGSDWQKFDMQAEKYCHTEVMLSKELMFHLKLVPSTRILVRYINRQAPLKSLAPEATIVPGNPEFLAFLRLFFVLSHREKMVTDALTACFASCAIPSPKGKLKVKEIRNA